MAKVQRKTLRFDTKFYPTEALMDAAFKFLDRAYIHFETLDGTGRIAARCEARTPCSDKQWSEIVDAFRDEVLGQALRLKVLRSTKKTRDQILSIALYCAPSSEQAARREAALDSSCAEDKMDAELDEILKKLKEDSCREEEDYSDDPSGILIPWEEKYSGAMAGDKDEERD